MLRRSLVVEVVREASVLQSYETADRYAVIYAAGVMLCSVFVSLT